MRENVLRLSLFLMIVVIGLPARAENVDATISVGALVVDNCQVTVSDVSFGAYDPLGSNASAGLDTASRLSLMCTKDVIATVGLDEGLNADSGAGGRQMALADFRLTYGLFRDGERRQRWSDGEFAVRLIGTGDLSRPQDLVVYGRIPPGQVVPAGTYSDVVTARVDF